MTGTGKHTTKHSIRMATKADHARIYDIWARSVKATHDFLSEADFTEIAEMVKVHYIPNAPFHVIVDDSDIALGFMGLSTPDERPANVPEGKSFINMDSLFLDPDSFGLGLGKALLQAPKDGYDIVRLDVNEQNPKAHGFYTSQGFVQTSRSETDDQGRPFPILHMMWTK